MVFQSVCVNQDDDETQLPIPFSPSHMSQDSAYRSNRTYSRRTTTTLDTSSQKTPRLCVQHLLESPRFNFVMGCIIFSNVLVIIRECDINVKCQDPDIVIPACQEAWTVVANRMYLCV